MIKARYLFQPHKGVLFFILIVFNLWLLTACQSQWVKQGNNEEFQLMENEQLYAAQDTGQIIVKGDKLRIGIGNIWDETYINESGNTTDGVTSGLWLFFKDDPDSDYHLRVYQGQSFDAEGYIIRIVEINKNDGMVVVGIIPPSKLIMPE